MITYLLLGAAISAEITGTMFLKRSEGFTRPLDAAAVIVFYAAAFVLLARVLDRGMSVAVAYALWAAVGIVAVAALGVFIFDDRLGMAQMAGIAIIVVGVVVLELGSSN